MPRIVNEPFKLADLCLPIEFTSSYMLPSLFQDQPYEFEVFRLYNILSALRGPDIRGPGIEALKRIMTGRIRVVVFGTYLQYGPVMNSDPLTAFDIAQVKKILKEWFDGNNKVVGFSGRDCLRHYLIHTYYAVQATRSHQIWKNKHQADKLLSVLGKYT